MADPATIYTGIVTAAEAGSLLSSWGSSLVAAFSASIENIDWGSVAKEVLGKVFSKDQPAGVTLEQLLKELNKVTDTIVKKMAENEEKRDLESINETLYEWNKPGGLLVKIREITMSSTGLTIQDVDDTGVLSELAAYLEKATARLRTMAVKYGSFERRFKTLGLVDNLATLLTICHEWIVMTAMSSVVDILKWSVRPGYTTIPSYYKSVKEHPVVAVILGSRTIVRAWCDAYLIPRASQWKSVTVRRGPGRGGRGGLGSSTRDLTAPIRQYWIDQGGDQFIPNIDGQLMNYPGNPIRDLWCGDYGPSAGIKVQAAFDAWTKIYNASECVDKDQIKMDVVYKPSGKRYSDILRYQYRDSTM